MENNKFVKGTPLFKYRALNKGNLKWMKKILREGKIRATHFEKLNDPMEGIYLANEKIAGAYDEKKKLRICSFSKNYDIPLLWAHYADEFKGVVLKLKVVDRVNDETTDTEVFDFEQLPEYLTEEKQILVEVNYKEKYEDLEPAKPTQMLSRKLDFWDYEEEVRALRKQNGAEKVTYVDVEIQEVIYLKLYKGNPRTEEKNEFIDQLKEEFGDKIEFIGKNISEILMNYEQRKPR